LRVDFAREVVGGDQPGPGSIGLSAGAATHILKPVRRAVEARSRTEYDLSSADVPPSFLLDAGDSIAVADASDAPVPPPVAVPSVKLSTLGLASALASLLPSCRNATAP
jgi:hypothetical protein